MPLKKAYTPTPPPPAAEPSLLDRIGGIPGVLAGATRAITGAASAEGNLPGAAISGLGELGAEALEGSMFQQSPWRTLLRAGTAAGIGAVPFGSVLKEGQPLGSALRGALYSGAGTAATEAAAGQELDPTAIGTSAAGGGLLTGALAKLFGGKAPEGPKWEVEPTSRGGIGKTAAGRAPRPITKAAEDIALESRPPAVTPSSGAPITGTPASASGRVQKLTAKELADATKEALRDQQNLKRVQQWSERNAALKAKAEQQAKAAAEIARLKEGMVPTTRVSESFAAPTELGTERATVSYAAPEDEVDDTVDMLSGYRPTKPTPPPAPPIAPVSEPESPVSALKQLFLKDLPEGEHIPVGAESQPTPINREDAMAELRKVFGVGEPGGFTEEVPADVVTHPRTAYQEHIAEPPPPVTPESVAGAKAAAEAERAQFEAAKAAQAEELAKQQANQEAQATRKDFTVVPPKPTAIEKARATFPDEVNAELDRLGEAYRSAPAGPEKRALGSQLSEIRDFMSGKKMRDSWRGAPEAPVEPPVGPPAPVQATAGDMVAEGRQTAPTAPEAPLTAEDLAKQRAATEGPEYVPSTEPSITKGEMSPADIEAEMRVVEKARQDPNFLDMLKRAAQEEKGAVNPALLAKLGLGLGGAAVGATMTPEDRLKGAAIGGAAGLGLAAAPQILASLGAHPSTFENLGEKINTEGIKATANKIFKTLPQVQRFNYLFSTVGLPANAVAGPYGSAIMGALEHGLSGDPRGWEALKNLTPMAFAREMRSAYGEASRLVSEGELGRAEGLGSEGGSTALQRALATPGVAMTAGDVAARKFLERAGFTEAEARRITLTSEPELQITKKIADFGKGRDDITKDLGNIIFPFRRTPANIWEQGMERFPGLGSWIQSQRDIPDPIKQQVMQQLLSTGVMGVSALAGANLDPETSKIVKRYMTNFAGQYSLPATMGFAAGQAFAGGKPIIPATVQAGVGDLPLPTTQPITEFAKFISDPSMQTMPSGAVPAIVREYEQLQPKRPASATGAKPRRLSRLRGR